MHYHLILCTRKHESGNINLDTIFREVLKDMQLSEKQIDGATLLSHNAILLHDDQMYRLGALILAELIERKFPYFLFHLEENTWLAYDNTGNLIENILKKS